MSKMNISKIALASLSLAGAALIGLWAIRNPEKAKKAFSSATDAMKVAGTKVASVAAAVPAAVAATKMNGADGHRLDA
jgi:hypothetical protein